MDLRQVQDLQTSEDITEISFSGMAFLDQHSQTFGFRKSTTLFYGREGRLKTWQEAQVPGLFYFVFYYYLGTNESPELHFNFKDTQSKKTNDSLFGYSDSEIGTTFFATWFKKGEGTQTCPRKFEICGSHIYITAIFINAHWKD